MKNKFKKVLKVFLWIIGSIFGLILLLIVSLQIPYVQNIVKDKAVTFLEGKIHTKVEVGSITIGLPKKVIITDFYFEDQSGDTLLAGKKIDVDVSLFKLLSNTLEINHVTLDNITAKIDKNKDSVFNFNYIIDAFASAPDTVASKPMEIKVTKIKIHNTYFRYDDVISKNDFNVKIQDFETKFDAFDLDKLAFDIPKIKIDGLKLVLNQSLQEAVQKSNQKVKQETDGKSLSLKLNKIDLSKIDVSYVDENSKLTTNITFQKLNTTVKLLDLEKQKIELDNFMLEKTKGKLINHRNSTSPSILIYNF